MQRRRRSQRPRVGLYRYAAIDGLPRAEAAEQLYLPSFLLLIGVLPFWDMLRGCGSVQSALRGVNAAVVGLLLAALYTPVWTSGITSPKDFAIAISAFLLLVIWHMPPWVVVALGAGTAWVVAA